MALLEVRKLTKRFGGLVALDDVSFEVEKEEIVGLIGPNGAGKTTLFNCVTGFYKPDSGEIHFDGYNMCGLKPHETCLKGMARTFQIVKAFHSMRVIECVTAGALARTDRTQDGKKKALETLEFVGLADKKNVLAGSLTIVDRKRLGLASALATGPKLMLLDEVAAGLNPVEIDDVIRLLRKIRDGGTTLFIVEHVMKLIMPVADRVAVLHHGKKIAEGRGEEVARDEAVIEAYLGRE